MTLETDLRVTRARSSGAAGSRLEIVKDLYRALSRVLGGLQSADGASQTTTVYQIDATAGHVLLGGVSGTIAALDDKDLLNPAHIKSYRLNGTAPVALTADGKTYAVALCVFLVSGTPALRAIFGAEANDGAEVAPTVAQCFSAMKAAAEAGYKGTPGLLVGRIKIQRVATNTITMTHSNVGTTAELILSRGAASIGV